jgi:hypothetical protein
MAEKGYLVIADITGYTSFLSDTELEHAQDSLRSLLELLVNHTKEPLRISRLEGDAVISFALDDTFIQSQTLLENLETTYVAFRQAQQRMRLNTTCDCMACKNIPNLDLKFLVHYGEFMLQDIGPYTELIGPEINLGHRLLKNTITEATGIKAYAAFTQAAVDAIEIEGQADRLVVHLEPDEYVDEVKLYIQDLRIIWQKERELHRIQVLPEEALVVIEDDFIIGPTLLWDYLTTPEYRAILDQADSVTVESAQDGRISRGSIYVCAHGEHQTRQAIVDWRPFDYYTFQVDGMLPGTNNMITVQLLPTDTGSRVVATIGHTASSEDSISQQYDEMLAKTAPEQIRIGCRKLQERIKTDLELGVIVQPKTVTMTAAQISMAVNTALANPVA